MRISSTLAVAAAVQILSGAGANRLAAQGGPLFASHDLVELTIQAPFRDIFEHRGQDSEEYPGVVVMGGESGEAHTVTVDIRTRGRTRLEKRICRFPPLRLDFPKNSVEGTLFEGQNKLKLVTHCQDDREEYEQYVLLEYLTYRIYNTLTELSFRARLARITYEDSEGDRDTVTRYGFIIEHEETVAERTGWSYIAAPGIPPRMYDLENLAQAEMFHYLIGNTDYSAVQADPGSSECCHNTKPIGAQTGPVFTVPHDFDMSGLLNTRYANRLYRANLQSMGLRSVRQRRFRGLCQSQPLWPVVFASFNERRSEIEGLFQNQEGLDEDVLEETLEYIEDFYEVINDEGKVRGEFERRCR
jgi:hypothetical protein